MFDSEEWRLFPANFIANETKTMTLVSVTTGSHGFLLNVQAWHDDVFATATTISKIVYIPRRENRTAKLVDRQELLFIDARIPKNAVNKAMVAQATFEL